MNGLLQHLIAAYAVTLSLLAIRCLAVFSLVPVFNGVAVPMRVRGAVAVIIAVVLTPAVQTSLAEAGLAVILQAAIGELLLGLCMGLIVRLSFYSAEFAGGALGLQMGLAFSQVVDPLSQEQSPISSRLLGVFAAMLLVAVDGHRMVLAALATSASTIPPGAVLGHFDSPSNLLSLLSLATVTGLRIAAPVMVALFVSNVALGLLARAAPQLQLFVLSFGLSIMLGMMVLMGSSRYGLGLVAEQVSSLGQQLAQVVGI